MDLLNASESWKTGCKIGVFGEEQSQMKAEGSRPQALDCSTRTEHPLFR